MPKAKGQTRKQKFNHSVNPNSHIRHSWDHVTLVRQNLAKMEWLWVPNKAVPLHKRKVKAMKVDLEERPQELVWKPSHRLRTLPGGEPWGGPQVPSS